jgi:hypothetical protein
MATWPDRDYHAHMGDESDAPTGLAPTELGAAVDETEAHTAWALDPDVDAEPALTPRRITTLAVAGALVLTAAAGVTAALYLRGEPAPVAVPAPPTTTAPSSAPAPWISPKPSPPDVIVPPPVTVTSTVQAAPPARTVEPPLPAPLWSAADDRRFIAALQADNWAVWNAVQLAESAHAVCASLQRGYTPTQVAAGLADITRQEAWSFVSAAMRTYPNCP